MGSWIGELGIGGIGFRIGEEELRESSRGRKLENCDCGGEGNLGTCCEGS